jgi:hypothetical protein
MLVTNDNHFWDFMQKAGEKERENNAKYNRHFVALAHALHSDQKIKGLNFKF